MTVICGILLLLSLVLGWYFWHRHKMMHQIVGIQPYMIMVDGIQYRNFSPVQTEKPEGAPVLFIR